MKNYLPFFFIFLFLTLSLSCRKEEYVDFALSGNYYYSEDKTKILYDSETRFFDFFSKSTYKELAANAGTFDVLDEHVGKDDKQIFYKETIVRDVDYETFRWGRKTDMGRDKKHVFAPLGDASELKIVKYADPETYGKVDSLADCLKWYRDKKHYFYNHERIFADRATLSFESMFLPYDKKHVFFVNEQSKVEKEIYRGKIVVVSDHLIYDYRKIYFHLGCDSTIRRIPYKDINTFKSHGDQSPFTFEIDAVIFIKGIATLLDNISFTILRMGYYKDDKYVYYWSHQLKDVDVATFKVLEDGYAKDKSTVYKRGKELVGYKSDDFVKDNRGRYPDDPKYGETSKSRRKKSFWRDDD